jgi:indole-3-acetate monooxygenase
MTAGTCEVELAVRAHQEEIERDRRMPDAVVNAMRRSGLHRLAMPSELGGSEVPVAATADAIAAVAAANGSAGWCAAIGAGSNVLYPPFLLEPGPGS